MGPIVISLLSAFIGLAVGLIPVYYSGVDKALISSVVPDPLISYIQGLTFVCQVTLSVAVFFATYGALLSRSLMFTAYSYSIVFSGWLWLSTVKSWESRVASLLIFCAAVVFARNMA